MTEPVRYRTPVAAPAQLPAGGHITLLPPKVLAIIAQSLPPDDIRRFLRTCKVISSAKAAIEAAIRKTCLQAFDQFFSHVDRKILTRKPLEPLRTLAERQVVKLLIQEIFDQLTLQNTLPSKVAIQYLLISFLGTLNDVQFDLLASAIATAHGLKVKRKTPFIDRYIGYPINDAGTFLNAAFKAGKMLLTSSHRSLTGSLQRLRWQPNTEGTDPHTINQILQAHKMCVSGTAADFKMFEKEFSKTVVPIFQPYYFRPRPLTESELEHFDHLYNWSLVNVYLKFVPIVECLAEMQRVPRAITISGAIANINLREGAIDRFSFILECRCVALAKLQRFTEAIGKANEIPHQGRKSEALRNISLTALELKNLHLAISVARTIPIPSEKDQAFFHIICSLIDLQRFILATSIVQQYHSKWQKDQLFYRLCWHLGKLERFTQVHTVANKIAAPYLREYVYKLIEEYRELVAQQEFASQALLS
jgi:hypothetical protein